MSSDRNSSNGLQPETKRPSAKREPVQAKLLQLVTTEVEERLAQSLHNAVPLVLGEQQDHQVQRPWSATVVQDQKAEEVLATGTRIIEVFDRPEIARQLLILGEPGSGKTTTLLELAQALLDRAKRDESEPIPVILDLSTWKGSGQPMVEWLSTELQAKYGLRPDFARKWVEKQQLLPLLDGLDEVAPQHQEVSVLALRAWLTGALEPKPCGVVICCRREELEQGVWQFLNVYGAIDLKALSLQQIEEYLAQVDLPDVWQAVHQDAALQELLTKPLFLSMFALIAAQGKFVVQDWSARSTSEKKIEYLLDTYWEATIERKLILDSQLQQKGIRSKTYGKKSLPTRQAVRRVLVFASKTLNQDSSTEILIEKLQPSVLINYWQKWSYRLIFSLIDGLSMGLVVGMVFAVIYGGIYWLIIGLTLGIIGGLIDVLFLGLTHGKKSESNIIYPVKAVSISKSDILWRFIFQSIREWLMKVLMFGLIIELISGLIIWQVYGLTIGLIFWPVFCLINGLASGLIIGLFLGLTVDIENRTELNQGIKKSTQNMVIVGMIALSVGLFVRLLIENLLGGVVPLGLLYIFVAVSLITLTWLSLQEVGRKALSRHIALRIVLAWNRYAPFRYDLLLDYCTERLLLKRIGGRYRFMHRLLQDHFAQMDL